MNKKTIFPQPEIFEVFSGFYNLPQKLTFSGYKNKKIKKAAELIFGEFAEKQKNDTISAFFLELIDTYSSDTYAVHIDGNGIKISGSGEAGFINGLLTVKQLALIYNNKIPCARIMDSPAFSWRGIMIDVCRHFHGPVEIMRLIPVMAMFRMNRLHLHLSEDQGWRFESKKYPRLTKTGSVREKTMISYRNPRTYRDTPHGGFFTKNELREIIELADCYNITVVPEIEMPGHSLAALASYPELGCGGEYRVSPDFGIFRDVMCPGNEKTLEFCKDIISEVADVFPSEYIHIGGDEVLTGRWEQCEKCRSRKESLGLENFRELQYWFTEEIRKHAASLGRKIICWNEAIHSGADMNICIQFWKGKHAKFSNFLKEGGRGIISDYYSLYFDHSHRFSGMNDVYRSADNYRKDIATGNVLGFEAPLWTEWVPNRERLDHQLFPRLAALAEVCWHAGACRKEFMSHEARKQLYALLEKLSVFPAPEHAVNPFILFKKAARKKELMRQWDTPEYRKMPVAGVPNDLDTRIS
ncbi:MAG: beta-N-acetylhexosaminidase [Spirochaetales bacterium]|nr:beta-N-acetylhexosaminidase [Spirochaetales bacterium]